MSNILLLLLCLLIGMILRGSKTLAENAPTVLNGFIVNISVPAVTLLYAVEINFTTAEILPIAAAWLVLGLAFIFFNATKRFSGFDRQTVGALILTAGISSISFVGFPLFELMYGAEGLKAGILMSQVGTFLACSTVGIALVSIYGQQNEKPILRDILRDVFTFPPFVAFVVALILKFSGYHHPSVIREVLMKLGGTLNILALVSIGLQLSFSRQSAQIKPLVWGLIFKIVAAPMLIFFIFFILLGQSGVAAKVSVVGSTLGSMNTIGIVAIRKRLNPDLVVQMLGISIPLSLLVVPLVYYLLEIW